MPPGTRTILAIAGSILVKAARLAITTPSDRGL